MRNRGIAAVLGALCLAACSTHEASGLPPATSTSHATPTPTVDPETAARQQITAAFAAWVKSYATAARSGGVGWNPDHLVSGTLLRTAREFVSNQQHVGNVITGTMRATGVRVEHLSLGARPTAELQTCLLDNFTARNGHTKRVVFKPGGKYAWTYHYVRRDGRWLATKATLRLDDPEHVCG